MASDKRVHENQLLVIFRQSIAEEICATKDQLLLHQGIVFSKEVGGGFEVFSEKL
jgi:hypothetical protein